MIKGIPCFWATEGLFNFTHSPSAFIVPMSGLIFLAKIFIKVDFPASF